MVQLHQDRPPVVRQSVDDPALPQRTIAIQPPLHHLCRPPEQRGIVTGPRQGGAPHMVGDVDVGARHPLGSREVEGLPTKDLAQTRYRHDAFGQVGGERVEVGHWSGEYRDGPDGKAHMTIGVLGLEESRVKYGQLLHILSLRPRRTPD
jgi:hypothetical protein